MDLEQSVVPPAPTPGHPVPQEQPELLQTQECIQTGFKLVQGQKAAEQP